MLSSINEIFAPQNFKNAFIQICKLPNPFQHPIQFRKSRLICKIKYLDLNKDMPKVVQICLV